VGVAPGRLPQGPDDIQSPYGERPCDGDGLQDVRREIGLLGVELAPFAGACDLAGVGDRGGPVKPLVECIAYEGAGCCVVAAHARVYVLEELAPLGDGHALCRMPEAARLYSSSSMRVNDLAILAMHLASDRSEGSSPRSVQAIYLSR
jgi:hypothetical protein